jgi:hypothetical protein
MNASNQLKLPLNIHTPTIRYINLTPHVIRMNDGRVFNPSGIIARAKTKWGPIENDISIKLEGKVINLPEPVRFTMYIVSAIVLGYVISYRTDCVCPATGHPAAIRSPNGQIVSVPCFTYSI